MNMTDSHETSLGRAHASSAIALGPGLALQGTPVRFRRNEEIFGQDEKADYVYRVISGAVRTIRFSSDGGRQIMAFHLPGDVFGFELEATHRLAAEAVNDAEIALVRRTLLERAAASNAEAARALLDMISRHLMMAREHSFILGRKGANERVAAFLLELAERFGPKREIDLPMSRADIADYLALTIETVSRAFTHMERGHAIALPSSRHVVLCNRDALEQLQAA